MPQIQLVLLWNSGQNAPWKAVVALFWEMCVSPLQSLTHHIVLLMKKTGNRQVISVKHEPLFPVARHLQMCAVKLEKNKICVCTDKIRKKEMTVI